MYRSCGFGSFRCDTYRVFHSSWLLAKTTRPSYASDARSRSGRRPERKSKGREEEKKQRPNRADVSRLKPRVSFPEWTFNR